jgi:hypothetical protein
MSKVRLFPLEQRGLLGYLKSCNMDLRGGTIKPAPRQIRIDGSANQSDDPAPTMIRWTHGGVPAAWYGQYLYLKTCQEGAITNEATVTATFTDICRFATGAATPVAAIIGCYGNGDFIDSFDSAAVPTASTDVKLVYATMAGADLYGVTNKGVYSTYHVSKCPAGNDPLVAASWGTGLPVGSPMYPINSIRSLGNAVVISKPEGIFVLEATPNAYVNRLDCEVAVHDDNGKGMFTGKGHVFIPMADGSLWMFDGYNLTDIGPKHYCVHHRDNPHLRAPITAGCVAGDWVYVATAPWEVGWTQEFGLKVYKYVTATTTYTDLTTNTTDGKSSTVGAVGSLTSGDYIYVGADIPFEAVKFTIGTANTTANARFNSCAIYETVTVTPGWYNPTCNFSEGTWSAGKGLAKNGYIRVLGYTADFGVHPVMTKTTNGGTLPDKYWARFAVAGTFSAGTTIAEIVILPSRPAVCSGTFSGDTAPHLALANGNFEYTGPDNAGMYPHILAGRMGPNGWEWWDVFTIQATAPVKAMAYMELDTGQTEENAGPRLVMATQHHNHIVMMGRHDRLSAPVNENYADGATMGTPIVYPLPTDLSDSDTDRSTIVKETEQYHVYGEYVNSSDTLTVLQRFDHNKWDKAGTASNAPVVVPAPHSQGLVLETAIAYEDPNATEIAGPSISGVDVEFTDTTAEPTPQADAVTPEVE